MGEKGLVTVSIVGTESTDGGGVAPTPSGTVASTPGTGQPNLLINVVSPLMALVVRFVSLFLVTFSGFLTTAGIGIKIFAATDLQSLVVAGAWMSLVVAGVGLVKNLVTIFGRLEGKYPLATGSI